MNDFVRDAKQTLRQFGRECASNEGLTLLAYIVLVATQHTALHEPWASEPVARLLPHGDDWMIRKDVLDLLLFGAAPLLLVALVHRQSPVADYGLKLPARRWVIFTAVIFAAQLVGIAIACQIPSLRGYYPMFRPAREGGSLFWGFQALAFLAMVAWEFLHRGYLMFGLRRLGPLAVIVQTIPFAILHFGKPTLELYWSIFDGLALGLLAWVSRSIWPAVWLHAVGALLLDIGIVYIFP